MANIDTNKLVNLGNLQYYDQKIKDYTENKIKEINLSDLADDAEHRTVTDTDIKTWNEKSDFSGDYEDLSNIPSDLATTGSVASALSEAKTYTDNELAKFDFIKVVDGLPETGLENKIYLVPIAVKSGFLTGDQNLFDEWIWVNKGTEDAPEYVWEWVTTKQLEVDLTPYATTEYVDTNKVQIVTTGGTGSAYTATVPGITSLTTGVSFVMIPHVVSASTSPTLNVNGLGATEVRRHNSSTSGSTEFGYSETWLSVNTPITVIYDGEYWIVEDQIKPSAADLNGIVPIIKGGTNASTPEDAVANLKSALVDLIYPIGSIYMSLEDTDPSTLFGGFWTRIEDRFLIGAGGSYVVEDKGGEATHTLTIDEMPHHNHGFTYSVPYNPSRDQAYNWGSEYSRFQEETSGTNFAGGGQAHNNMPPYLAVYMWQRVSHEGHSVWTNADITMIPTITSNTSTGVSRTLTLSYPITIANSDHVTTNNLEYSIVWYMNGVQQTNTTAIFNASKVATYSAKVTVSGTLVDSEGCISNIYKEFTSGNYVLTHDGHCEWNNDDVSITPTITRTGSSLNDYVLHASYTMSINSSSYITTNNLKTSYQWYKSSYPMSYETGSSIYPEDYGTFKVEITVSGTLVDNAGCSSYIYKTVTASYTM